MTWMLVRLGGKCRDISQELLRCFVALTSTSAGLQGSAYASKLLSLHQLLGNGVTKQQLASYVPVACMRSALDHAYLLSRPNMLTY